MNTCETPRSVSVMVTFAPTTTALLGSVTVPRMRPFWDWVKARLVQRHNTHTNRKFLIITPPQSFSYRPASTETHFNRDCCLLIVSTFFWDSTRSARQHTSKMMNCIGRPSNSLASTRTSVELGECLVMFREPR